MEKKKLNRKNIFLDIETRQVTGEIWTLIEPLKSWVTGNTNNALCYRESFP